MKLNTEEITALRNLLSQTDLKGNPILEKLAHKLSPDEEVELYVDGAADLHSKTAGIGGVFYRNGDELFSFSEYLHDATNNEAEYQSLITGIKTAIQLKLTNLIIYSDSELVVRQINGVYKVKNPRIQVLYRQAVGVLGKLDSWTFTHVPREKNQRADALSKEGRFKGKQGE